MEYFIAGYASSLQANRVKKLAERELSYVVVTQVPAYVSDGGCNYAVQVHYKNKNILKGVSCRAGCIIRVGFVLTTYSNGRKEYIRL